MEILAKGTVVKVITEVAARSIVVGRNYRIVARFELPAEQGGRHYRLSSTRTDTNFTGAMVPATAIEAIS